MGSLGAVTVACALTSHDTLIVQSARTVGTQASQALDVSSAKISFVSPCLGDFDDNGMVDFADFVLFVSVFDTYTGDASYNGFMDMDKNGIINISDFVLFVRVFDTTCEQGPSPDGGSSGVSIPDANLCAVIEDSLGKASGAPITPAEMATLTRLSARNSGIRDLTGLEHATNLTYLELWSNSIKDVSALSSLAKVEWLYLGRTSLSDVSALSSLTNLTELHLPYNNIKDVSGLSSLTNLTVLLLQKNSISDLSPLVANSGLGQGDYINVTQNPLSATSLNTHIPALYGRGVHVWFDEILSKVNAPAKSIVATRNAK